MKIIPYSHIVRRATVVDMNISYVSGAIYEQRTLIRRAISGNHTIFPVTISLYGSSRRARED